MSAKQFYHDIDLVNAGQLVGARIQNVTSTSITTLAGTLGADNKGLIVYNTSDSRLYTWNGTGFDPFQIDVTGDIKFAGIINPANAGTVAKTAGFQYYVDTAGTLTATGVTFSPTAVVEVGDQVLFASPTQAYVLERNDVQATETLLGKVRLATQAEANAGTENTAAVTSATLHGYVDPQLAADRARIAALEGTQLYPYFATVNIAANTPFSVTHNLNLSNKDAFVIRTALGGSDISLDVDSVSSNALTLTSLVPLTGVTVYVIGR